MTDKYDEAIEWLVEHADDRIVDESGYGRYRNVIDCAWNFPFDKPGGLLFQCCTVDGRLRPKCGCITEVRLGAVAARVNGEPVTLASDRAGVQGRKDIADEIASDTRIPRYISAIADLREQKLRTALKPFAEWQRRLDREIREVKEQPV